MTRIIIILFIQILLFGCNNDSETKTKEYRVLTSNIIINDYNIMPEMIRNTFISNLLVNIHYIDGSIKKDILLETSSIIILKDTRIDYIEYNGYKGKALFSQDQNYPTIQVVFTIKARLEAYKTFPKAFPNCTYSSMKINNGVFLNNITNIIDKPSIYKSCKHSDKLVSLDITIEPLDNTYNANIEFDYLNTKYHYYDVITFDTSEHYFFDPSGIFYNNFYLDINTSENILIKIKKATYQKLDKEEYSLTSEREFRLTYDELNTRTIIKENNIYYNLVDTSKRLYPKLIKITGPFEEGVSYQVCSSKEKCITAFAEKKGEIVYKQDIGQCNFENSFFFLDLENYYNFSDLQNNELLDIKIQFIDLIENYHYEC